MNTFPGTTQEPLTRVLDIPGLPEQLGRVRSLILEIARQAALPRDVADDLLVATGEAVNNAVLHGSPQGARSAVRVVITVTQDIAIDIFDRGPAIPRRSRKEVCSLEPLAALAESGRGIPIMHALMDTVEFRRHPDGNWVRLVKHLPVNL